MVHGVRGEAVALRGVRADVGDERRVDGDDGAVVLEADAHLVLLLAIVAHRGEVLPPALHPFHRTREAACRERHEDLLGIDRALRPEAAADVRHEHGKAAQLFATDALDRRDDVAQAVRALRR